jgi:hypothetical protein
MRYATYKENLDKERALDGIFLWFPIISSKCSAHMHKKEANLDFDIHDPFIEGVFAVFF